MLRICGCLVVFGMAALQALQPAAPVQPAPPPSTDIYLLAFAGGPNSMSAIAPEPVAALRGYENQPFFADNNTILFTANRDGKQTDIFEFDRTTKRTRQLVATPEAEYSPTLTPDGKAFSVIRVESDGTQRLWMFDRDGTKPRVVLQEVKPVGYHAWIDSDRLALFVLGKPATLQLARVSTGKAEQVASGVGRSIHRVPGKSTVSFVFTRENDGGVWVNEYDPDARTVTPLVKAVAGSTDRDCAWMPDGTLLMSAGTRIFAWKRGDADWREVYDSTRHKLGNVWRIAVSPDSRVIAIVVAEPKG